MSLSNTLSQVFTRKRATAREHYLTVLRDGSDAELIATAAESAGIAESEVQEHVKVLEQARTLTTEAEKLPTATVARWQAVGNYEKAQQDFQEAIDRLQPLVAQAWNVAHQSEAVEAEKRRKADELRGLYSSYPELLPMEKAPGVIKNINAEIQGQVDRERAKLAKQQRLSKARERYDDAKYQLAHAGDRRTFQGKPTSLAGPSGVVADERRELAQAEFEAAEAERDAAAKALEEDGK